MICPKDGSHISSREVKALFLLSTYPHRLVIVYMMYFEYKYICMNRLYRACFVSLEALVSSFEHTNRKTVRKRRFSKKCPFLVHSISMSKHFTAATWQQSQEVCNRKKATTEKIFLFSFLLLPYVTFRKLQKCNERKKVFCSEKILLIVPIICTNFSVFNFPRKRNGIEKQSHSGQ